MEVSKDGLAAGAETTAAPGTPAVGMAAGLVPGYGGPGCYLRRRRRGLCHSTRRSMPWRNDFCAFNNRLTCNH